MKRFVKILCSGIIATSMLLSSVSVFANITERIVKISTGNQIANVNGENVTLSVAPYVQQPSNSMMIPLRFVSTALGIPEENIQYNANTKEITINYNKATVTFIANTNKLILNGESFDMFINNTHPVYTEIKNGNTFIPLRALESAFGIKIDWESSTKTAIMTNTINSVDSNVENNNEPIINETENNTNESIKENNTENIITEEIIKEEQEKFLKLINEERGKNNLEPVQISEKLMQTAQEKSEDMAKNKYFGHENQDGYNMAKELNVNENISKDFNPDNKLDYSSAYYNWLNSKSGHKENMLNPNVKYIGLGFAYDSDNSEMYYTLQITSFDKWANQN